MRLDKRFTEEFAPDPMMPAVDPSVKPAPPPPPPPPPGPKPFVHPLSPLAPYLDPFGIAPHLPNIFGPGGIGDPFGMNDDDDGDGVPNGMDPDFYKKVYRDPKGFLRRFRNRRRR